MGIPLAARHNFNQNLGNQITKEQGHPLKHAGDNPEQGWYLARISMRDGEVIESHDYVMNETMARASGIVPADKSAVPVPKDLSWKPVKGTKHNRVFIKDLWDNALDIEFAAVGALVVFLDEGILNYELAERTFQPADVEIAIATGDGSDGEFPREGSSLRSLHGASPKF